MRKWAVYTFTVFFSKINCHKQGDKQENRYFEQHSLPHFYAEYRISPLNLVTLRLAAFDSGMKSIFKLIDVIFDLKNISLAIDTGDCHARGILPDLKENMPNPESDPALACRIHYTHQIQFQEKHCWIKLYL